MRILFIVLLLLVPVMTWGAEKKGKEKPQEKVQAEDLRTDLEEDICYVYFEFLQADRNRRGNPNFSSAVDIKRKRIATLVKRYKKRYGTDFDGYAQCPQMFPEYQQP